MESDWCRGGEEGSRGEAVSVTDRATTLGPQGRPALLPAAAARLRRRLLQHADALGAGGVGGGDGALHLQVLLRPQARGADELPQAAQRCVDRLGAGKYHRRLLGAAEFVQANGVDRTGCVGDETTCTRTVPKPPPA